MPKPHGVTACDRSHRRRRRSNESDRSSNIREELDRGIGRSNRSREVLEKGVERGGGEVERPAGGGLGADELVGAIRVGRPTDNLA